MPNESYHILAYFYYTVFTIVKMIMLCFQVINKIWTLHWKEHTATCTINYWTHCDILPLAIHSLTSSLTSFPEDCNWSNPKSEHFLLTVGNDVCWIADLWKLLCLFHSQTGKLNKVIMKGHWACFHISFINRMGGIFRVSYLQWHVEF